MPTLEALTQLITVLETNHFGAIALIVLVLIVVLPLTQRRPPKKRG